MPFPVGMPRTDFGNTKARSYCFTLNNYTDSDVKAVQRYLKAQSTYGVFGFEEGKNGTPHLQGYCEFRNARSFRAVHRALRNAHLEQRRGTSLQAADYCKKDGNFWEHGIISQPQGARNDIAALVADCKDATKSLNDLLEAHPVAYFRYHRHVAHVRSLCVRDTSFTDMNVLVYWGAAGLGKTRRATYEYPRFFVLPVGGSSKTVWFDGYDPAEHDAIIIDDFYGGCIKYGYLLKLLDGYRFNLPIKGGFVWKSYSTVVLTSNADPESWYPEGLTPALRRRIKSIVHFTAPWSPPASDPGADGGADGRPASPPPAVRGGASDASVASQPVRPGDSWPPQSSSHSSHSGLDLATIPIDA
jgi:hypothetical protein